MLLASLSLRLTDYILIWLEGNEHMVYELFSEKGVDVPDQVRGFFESHIGEIEVGHDNRLKEACLNDLTSVNDGDEFKKGYRNLMMAMDIWWMSLDVEAKNLRFVGNFSSPSL